MIYYGYGVYGIEVVFCLYFGKYVKNLIDVEVVLLVGILKGFFGYLLYVNEMKVKECQKMIVWMMEKQWMISYRKVDELMKEFFFYQFLNK